MTRALLYLLIGLILLTIALACWVARAVMSTDSHRDGRSIDG